MKKLIIMGLIATSIITLSACQSTDVVGKFAVTSYKELLDTNKEKVSFDEKNNHWVLISPSGEKFKWSRDFNSDKSDAEFEIDAKSFIDAGLDVSKLSKEKFIYDEKSQKIIVPFEIGEDKFDYNKKTEPIDSFKQIVNTNRDIIGYHEKLDHYGIALGDGHKFEWAKDMSKNDKDIVFILDTKPFIDAGVNPNKVKDWAFAKVEEGKDKKEVDKFLKPFNIK